MKFKEKQIKVNGNNVSYIDEGKSGDIPVIFIHGFPFNKAMWENQIEVLKENYRAIAYDVRGFGNSDPGTVENSIDQFAADLFLFMDALHCEKAIICGLSMGGYIALNAMLKQPARIAALVICDSQCLPDSEQAKKTRMETIASIQAKGLKDYARESVKKLFSEFSLANKKEEVSFIEGTILETSKEAICATLRALAGRKGTCSTLYLIDIPVLVIVGKEDQITTPEVAKQMHELIPGSILQVIDHAGHLSNLENPESFNMHLQGFLARIG